MNLFESLDSKLLRLSQRLNTSDAIRRLAINGLRMEQHTVQTHLQNHHQDINTAAYNIISEWRNSQSDDTAAFVNLGEALERVNMAAFIEELQ